MTPVAIELVCNWFILIVSVAAIFYIATEVIKKK